MDDLYNPSNFGQLLTRVPGNYLRKRWTLWDRQTYVSATTRSLNFFGDKVSGTKTLQATSMTANGSLPANNFFVCLGIQLSIFPGLNPSVFGAPALSAFINDTYLMSKDGVLQIAVDQKLIVQDAPLMKFPPQQSLLVEAALSDTTTAAAAQQTRIAYAQPQGPLYKVDPFLLEPMQNFTGTLLWPDAAVTLAGGNPVIQVDLVGLLFSPN